jgi:hypothetical protein
LKFAFFFVSHTCAVAVPDGNLSFSLSILFSVNNKV